MINWIILYSEFISCNSEFLIPDLRSNFRLLEFLGTDLQPFLIWVDLSNYSDVVYIQELIKIGRFKNTSVIKWFALRDPEVQTLIKWFALRAPEVQILIKWFALPMFRP